MSYDGIAKDIITEAQRRGYDPVPPLSTAIQESGLRPAVVSANGKWIGIYQQDTSYSDRNNPAANIRQFFDRLDAKRRTPGWSDDLWLNIFWLQQRPGEPSAELAYRNGRQAYLNEIKSRTTEAVRLVALYGGNVALLPARPDFNEYAMWSPSRSSRGGKKPTTFLLHTQEGDGNADSLARYLNNAANQVSYHYTVSQAADGGVTVCDVVDTDYASWSVGNANPISINLCFAGSRASWTRDQWLKQAKAIDVAAYLAVQDCKKYGISTLIVPPPYTSGTPGISDHKWVTDVFGWGSHTDVGPNFPWDVLTASVNRYSKTAETNPPNPGGSVSTPSTDAKLDYIYGQLQPYPQLAGKPDALDALRKKIADGMDLTMVDAMAAHIHGLFTKESN
ncbi:N-acetylmuramoyl-L-alanine amidase [Mycobacterium sp. CSUR Q5927]|nr:N-acetylmuramoyl-L-alanine amidase [Mycobacterium sp. CSUR Q5927]